jgi:5S rRNA maturation endonuclease (ribonuclease M5)
MNTKYLDLERLLDDFGIEYRKSGGDWIQLKCPSCYAGDGKFGLGWQGKIFTCFRCGRIDRVDVVSALLDTPRADTFKIISKYTVGKTPPSRHFDHTLTILDHKDRVKMPYSAVKMADRHRAYLEKRHFDPEALELEWGLLGTGPVGPFANRIIIPITDPLTKTVCCFQGRDITGKSPNKYKSCLDNEAVIPIKSCLYGLDRVVGDSVVVTEGPTKVWRLGAGSVCTFGATVTNVQVKLLKQFQRVFLLFDEDEAGQEGAKKVGKELAVFGMNTVLVTAGIEDVAELSSRDAAELMKELLKNK